MGFFNKRNKNNAPSREHQQQEKQKQQTVSPGRSYSRLLLYSPIRLAKRNSTPTTASESTGPRSVDISAANNNKPPSTTTTSSSSVLLGTLRVVAADSRNVEILTPESQQALLQQREAIRKKLFDEEEDPNDVIFRASTTPVRNTAAFRRTGTEENPTMLLRDRDGKRIQVDARMASIPITDSRSGSGLSWDYSDTTNGSSSLKPIAQLGISTPPGLNSSFDSSQKSPVQAKDVSAVAASETKRVLTPPHTSTSNKDINNLVRSAILVYGNTNPPLSLKPSSTAPLLSSSAVADRDTVMRSHSSNAQPKQQKSGPVSVDLAYTASELESVLSGYKDTTTTAAAAAAATTPPVTNKARVSTQPATGSILVAGTMPMDDGGDDTPAGTTITPMPLSARVGTPATRRRTNDPERSPLPDDERDEYQRDEIQILGIFANGGDNDHFVRPPTDTSVVVERGVDPDLFTSPTDTAEGGDTPAVKTPLRHSWQNHAPISFSASSSRGSTVPKVALSLAAQAFSCGATAFEQSVARCDAGLQQAVDAAQLHQHSSSRNHSMGGGESTTSTAVTTRRPVYFDPATTRRFLRRITNNGFALLHLQPPGATGNPNSDDWNGRTVTMMLAKGDTSQSRAPGLEWSTVSGGKMVDFSTRTHVDLLNVLSVSTNLEEMEESEDISADASRGGGEDAMCFFTITTENGDVHIFEAAHVEERDRIVNGIKTVLARLSFHLIAGDATATSELYESSTSISGSNFYDTFRSPRSDDRGDGDNDLPSLPNPNLRMNQVAHFFLDTL